MNNCCIFQNTVLAQVLCQDSLKYLKVRLLLWYSIILKEELVCGDFYLEKFRNAINI